MSDATVPPATATPAVAAPVTAPADPVAAPPPAAVSKRALPYGKAEKPVEADVSDATAKTEATAKPANGRALAMAKASVAKLNAEIESLKKGAQEIEALKKALGVHAASALSPLPKEWQEHIKKLANGDPRRELELVHETAHLRPAQTQAAPASTTAATAPKPQTEADADVVVAQRHADLKKTSPNMAAVFFMANRPAIERGNKKLAS